MDLKQIEKLMAAMERSSIKRIALKREGFEIELERECVSNMAISSHRSTIEMPHEAEKPVHRQHIEVEQNKVDGNDYVTSPMVGTFYSSPSPDDPPFVKVGDVIGEDTVICIIEAMKVMNEVKSGVKGKIVEIVVETGDPVEFGSKILRIEQ